MEPRDRVKDPIRPIIGAINSYQRAYHMHSDSAEARALSLPEIGRLDTMMVRWRPSRPCSHTESR